MDPDTRFAFWSALLGGASGSAAERLFTYVKGASGQLPAGMTQQLYYKSKEWEFVIYLLVAAVVVLAAIMLFPINRQNRPQVLGTAIIFGMVWPSVMDRLIVIAGLAIKVQPSGP